ncbi:MAG: BamA/TamA family outer membrane protein [Candidatus Melainabacteria bacterium]|nr:BamA/TamA family outer membrane protein [Candidatus Melainabacteria bacterium]
MLTRSPSLDPLSFLRASQRTPWFLTAMGVQPVSLMRLLLGVSLCTASAFSAVALAEDVEPSKSSAAPSAYAPTAAPDATPLTEFAPESVRSVSGKQYDQAVTISQVKIEGNRLISEEAIKEQMSIRPGSLYSRKNLQTDLRRVYDMGYFTEKIRAVPVSTRQGIILRIEVEENAPVTGVNIDGNTVIPDEELQSLFSEQTGLPQNIGQLNESIQKIEQMYADKGYVLARVTSIGDDPDGRVNLQIREGTIDKVQFVGNRKTKDNVVKRNMLTQAGQVYNEKLLKEDLQRIFATQAFSDVRRVITASPEDPEKYNLTIELDEKRTGSISLGGGLDTGTGLFGSVGFNDPNFLGRGQNFSSVFAVGTGVINRDETQANARTYQFELNWSTPSLNDTPNALATGVYGRDLASFNVPLAIERRLGAEVTWARPILSLPNTSFSLAVRGENVKLREGAGAGDLAFFNITPQQREGQLTDGTYLSVSPTLAYDTRDNRFNPTSGWFNSVALTGAYGVGADSYGIASANLRRYLKIREGVVLALNGQAGHSVLGDIPEFNMFRMGGNYSVRGFQEGGLGTGGGFMIGSAELRTTVPFIDRVEKLNKIPMLKSLRTVFFVDAGSLFNESVSNSLFQRSGYGYSMGMGVRLTVPGLGPIRVDYAIPLAGGGPGGRYERRFNFGVGQKF